MSQEEATADAAANNVLKTENSKDFVWMKKTCSHCYSDDAGGSKKKQQWDTMNDTLNTKPSGGYDLTGHLHRPQ